MITGVQFRGTLPPHQTQRWFTFNWSAVQHVLWEVVPDTAIPGAAQVDWDVAIERADTAHVTTAQSGYPDLKCFPSSGFALMSRRRSIKDAV